MERGGLGIAEVWGVTREEFEELREGAVVRNEATGSEWIVTHRVGNMAALTITDVIDDEDCDDFALVANGPEVNG